MRGLGLDISGCGLGVAFGGSGVVHFVVLSGRW
jgi:hypothetical protein